MAKISVQNKSVTIISIDGEDYVSITDLACLSALCTEIDAIVATL